MRSRAVPRALRDGSLAMGATRAETMTRVLLPAALPGIMGGILLALSRAIGETMIVVMAAGLIASMTINPLDSVTTVTVQIVTLLIGDTAFDSPKTLAAFALGLVLFLVTLASTSSRSASSGAIASSTTEADVHDRRRRPASRSLDAEPPRTAAAAMPPTAGCAPMASAPSRWRSASSASCSSPRWCSAAGPPSPRPTSRSPSRSRASSSIPPTRPRATGARSCRTASPAPSPARTAAQSCARSATS